MQLALQAVGPHKYGSHLVVGADAQLPAPSQVRAGVAVSTLHEAAAHWMPAGYAPQVRRSMPLHCAWHTPVPPHAVRVLCGAPVTATQVPTVVAASHASHWPAQAVLQHTPSTQFPFEHSCAPVGQASPFAFLVMHTPPEQNEPLAQPPSFVQVVGHDAVVPWQVKVPQLVRAPCGLPVTFVHAPREPETSHAWQLEPQLELQQ